MRTPLAAAAALHAALAIAMLALPDAQLTLTLRHQFNDWGPLLDLVRSPPPQAATVESMRESARNLTWCAAPLPPGTSRAPYCVCVDQKIDAYTNGTAWKSQDAAALREETLMGFVSCLSSRPVWRVRPVWGVHYGTPVVYALFVASSFLWVAAGLKKRWTSIPIWVLCVALSVALLAQAPLRNGLWAITLLLVAVLIQWVLLPGMTPPEAIQGGSTQEGATRPVDRVPSSFWWCEYLCAPVFALYVPLMHCGRDLLMTGIVVMIGGAVGGLGLRSYWCAQAYREEPKNQFRDIMQRITWLGILASSAAILCITGVYYRSHQPEYSMGKGSIVLMCVTLAISLLQWPGIPMDFPRVLQAQAALALARNVALFCLVAADLL
jgi:hypothetical protein